MAQQDYWSRIRATLETSCLPSDQLWCRRIVNRPGQTCQMCGHSPIRWNFIIENPRTGRHLVVGSECIRNYKEEMRHMGHNPPSIVFDAQYERWANSFNRKRPDTTEIQFLPEANPFAWEDGTELWVTEDDEEQERRRELGLENEDDLEDEERELLLGMGLDPDDPDFTELAAEGLEGYSEDEREEMEEDDDEDCHVDRREDE